jgi:outer membrane translocation and assembly module TamA
MIATLLFSGSTSAQLPRRLEQCLPYPTLAQEIADMRRETQRLSGRETPAAPIHILAVQFAEDSQLTPFLREEITRAVAKQALYEDPEHTWLGELEEVTVEGTLRNLGYFRAVAKAKAELIDTQSGRPNYSITLHIEEGKQYRLGAIDFVDEDDRAPREFSQAELRARIHLEQGQILNVSRIREGMEEIRRLYLAKGYVDFTMEPDVDYHEVEGTLEITMRIDKEQQYRIGKIVILWMNERVQRQLKSKPLSGTVYNPEVVSDFIAANKSLLPPDVSTDDVMLERHPAQGTVDILFDFRTCPQVAQPN